MFTDTQQTLIRALLAQFDRDGTSRDVGLLELLFLSPADQVAAFKVALSEAAAGLDAQLKGIDAVVQQQKAALTAELDLARSTEAELLVLEAAPPADGVGVVVTP